ncbi:MAG: hypothetical protein ACKO7D_00185 [Bacteroidota bacterium]
MIRFFVEYRLTWLISAPLLVLIFNLLNLVTGAYSISPSIDFGLLGIIDIAPGYSVLFSSFLILLNGFNITRIFNENDFFDKSIYSSGFLYLVLMSFYHSFYHLNTLLIVQSLMIIVVREVLLIQQQDGDQKHVFNGAFLLGLSACIHPPSLLYLFVFLVSIWSLKSFLMKDFILILVGSFLPFMYVGSYYFLNDKVILIDLFSSPTKWKIVVFDMLFTLINCSFLFLMALVSFRSSAVKSTLRLRKMMLPLVMFFIVGLGLGLYDFILFFQMDRLLLMLVTLPFFINYAFINRTYSLFAGILFIMALGYSFIKFFTVLPHS